MNGNIDLGRIAGVRVRINWSLLVVFTLIVWSLASGVFPSQNPGHSDGTYLVLGVTGAALFFASLLLHELGHARQALREGMEIEGITLWLFGGVAQLRIGLRRARRPFFSDDEPSAGRRERTSRRLALDH